MGNCAGSIMSNVIYFSEKFSMCLAFTILISCSIICMVCMLAFGIGLGYNYSYVDYRSKHIFISEQHKKVRPTSYYGPGFFRPTTLDPKLTTMSRRKKKTTKRWWYGQRAQMKNAGQESTVVEYVHELTEESQYLNPARMVVDDMGVDPVFKLKSAKKIENLYFSLPTSTSKPRFTSSLPPEDHSTTYMTTYVSNDTLVDTHNTTEEAGKASNDSDVNATKHRIISEPINVNVTKTRDSAPPFILKTMMHQNQLMKWLSKLQDANKTFAVHVITN